MNKLFGLIFIRCAPRLNEEAAALLSSQYVHIRNRIRQSLIDRPGIRYIMFVCL